MKELTEKRRISAEKTIEALKENGIDVDEKDAEQILDFLYFLAKLTVNQYINSENTGGK